MIDTNQLTLFGIDLNEPYQRLMLGVRQLLWGEEAGIKAKFCPERDLITWENLDDLSEPSELSDLSGVRVVMPSEQVLCATLRLPSSGEIYMEQAVSSFALANSPFATDDTCWGACIAERGDQELVIEIALVARSAAKDMHSRVMSRVPSLQGAFSLWARTDSGEAPLGGFEDSALPQQYFANLRAFGVRTFAGILGVTFLFCLPAIWISQTAQQYEDLLAETESSSRGAVAVRQDLVSGQGQLAYADRYHTAQPDYRLWLHRISEIAPDSVYLNRLSMRDDQITVTGLAENAAEFQSILVESGLFSDLNAPSAFTLDKRANRERFTLTMTIRSEARQ